MIIDHQKNLIDSIDNGHMLIDENFIVYYWNKWLEINTGIAHQAIVNESLQRFYPDLNYNVLKRKIKTALKLGTPSFYDQNSQNKFIPITRSKVTASSLTLMQQQITISPYSEKEGLVFISIYDISELYDTKLLLQKEINKVQRLNQELESRIEEALVANKKQMEHMIIQARQAQMGELLSMIAHQWRQPLSVIAASIIELETKIELGTLNINYDEKIHLRESLDTVNNCVQSLSTTIDDFRNFYKPNKNAEYTKLNKVCSKALNIINRSLETENIELIEEYDDSACYLYKNELMQVLLNILTNAQDNFRERKIANPYIKLTTHDRTISICDNGGGIAENIIDNIFDAYFSTKDEKNGTGLGLYMSKLIVELHHKGKLEVFNHDDGVCFEITIGDIR